MIKLVAFDLDDTFLNDNVSISPKNKKAIEFLKENDIKIAIATGRPFPSTKRFVDELTLDMPIITYQGAMVYDIKNKKKIYSKEVPIDLAKKLLDISEKERIHIHLYINDVWFVREYNEKTEFYKNLTGLTPTIEKDLYKILTDNPSKVLFFDEHDRLEEIKKQVHEIIKDTLETTFSKPFFLEFTNKEATKGQALKFLAEEHYNIKKEEVMAVGDQLNDLSMIEYAGIGVAVANGHEELKKHATFVTDTNNNDGFAKAIEKVFGVKLV
ncbi:Cof-type HAD-IIB family hydrolase [Caldicellulosiruptoraceae bacterium PP1]